MDRGGIKILPITIRDVRNELLTYSTTCAIPTRVLLVTASRALHKL
jgi:hypothetical protein